MARVTELNVNGVVRKINVNVEKQLLYALREDLGLTGSKIGCGEGECGACSVLVDGKLCRSCITPVGDVVGKQITTIEGLARENELHPIQQAFLDRDALQCGYCTSGMIIAGVALLNQNPLPTRDQIIFFMQGNVCRCGCYSRIVQAIYQAAGMISEAREVEVIR